MFTVRSLVSGSLNSVAFLHVDGTLVETAAAIRILFLMFTRVRRHECDPSSALPQPRSTRWLFSHRWIIAWPISPVFRRLTLIMSRHIQCFLCLSRPLQLRGWKTGACLHLHFKWVLFENQAPIKWNINEKIPILVALFWEEFEYDALRRFLSSIHLITSHSKCVDIMLSSFCDCWLILRNEFGHCRRLNLNIRCGHFFFIIYL